MSETGLSKAHCGKWPPDKRCQAKNIFNAGVRVLTAAARGGKIRVSKEVQERRQAICKRCKHFDPRTERCKLCGCYLRGILSKTALATESCPASPPRWNKEVWD